MNCRKIAKRSITYKNMNNNLKKHYGRTKKNRKIFYYICLVPLDQIKLKEGKRDIYTLLNLLNTQI